jgi:hypothetical protein
MYAEDAALKRALDSNDDIDAEIDAPPAASMIATTWRTAAPPEMAAHDRQNDQTGDDRGLAYSDRDREPGADDE